MKIQISILAVAAVLLVACQGPESTSATASQVEEAAAAASTASEPSNPASVAAEPSNQASGAVESSEHTPSVPEPSKQTSAPNSKAEATKMTREAFKAAVLGKTSAEIIAALGRPEEAGQLPGGGGEYWYYSHETMNPITQKADTYSTIIFTDGKASEVTF